MTSSRMKKISLFIAFFLSTGCASYRPKPVLPGETLSRFESRTLANPGLREYIRRNRILEPPRWPPKEWNLSLLTLAAFYYHPDLDVARTERDVEKAKVARAGERPNPRLSFTPAYNSDAASGVSPWILGLVLSFPIETAGRRGHRVEEAQHLLDAARLHIAEVAWRVRSRLRASLLELYRLTQAEAILKKRLEVAAKLLQAREQRLAAGEASRLEVEMARAALVQSDLSLGQARTQAAEERARLAQVLGVPLAALDEVKLSFDSLSRPPAAADIPSAAVQRQALTNRTDILAALARYAASQSSLQLEIARQYPDLQIGPGYQWDQSAEKWSLGLSLTLPVFHRNQGRIEEAKARRRMVAARFVALQAKVIGELDRALAGYRATLAELGIARSLAAVQRSREGALTKRIEAGYTDRVTLYDARLETLSAEDAELSALVRAQQALGALENAVERPLDGADGIPAAFGENPQIESSQDKGLEP